MERRFHAEFFGAGKVGGGASETKGEINLNYSSLITITIYSWGFIYTTKGKTTTKHYRREARLY